MALRMAARSTTHGTPVKSCRHDPRRLEGNLDTDSAPRRSSRRGFHVALGHGVAIAVSRSTASRRMRIEYGSRATVVSLASSRRERR